MTETISILRLKPHPRNIRRDPGDLSELVASIRAHGILQPLVVRPHPQLSGTFVVIAGHRRLEAAKLAGLGSVPVVVRDRTGPDGDVILMLVENCVRADLDPIDRARAMAGLRQRGYSLPRISEATGLCPATISHSIALLDLDKGSQDKIRRGEVTPTAAYEALRKSRSQRRSARGESQRGSRWEPAHFDMTHPLAARARGLCEGSGHPGKRQRVGKVACGQCWETVIRQDEQLAGRPLRVVPESEAAS